MKVAVQGCSHGELDAIYASILRAEQQQGFHVDLLLLCGDFQAIRNHADLECLAVPQKYRQLGGFHRYYSGEELAPILTLVIGGNHEASNYMWELYHGGWLAPNIYYLGAAGAVEVGGLTIAGASGIFKSHDYDKGRFERLPFDNSTMRSTYHARRYDIHRLKLLGDTDVVLSHDWPNTIEQHGDTAGLIKRKPYFAEEIKTHTLGSPPLLELLQTLKPPYWFSAHLHVKFAAVYDHDKAASSKPSADAAQAPQHNPEAIDIDIEDDDDDDGTEAKGEAQGDDVVDEEPKGAACQQHGVDATPTEHEQDDPIPAVASTSDQGRKLTRFLALSKCLPKADFLQYLDIPSRDDAEPTARKAAAGKAQRVMPTLRYSKRWLAITRTLHPELSLGVRQPPLPPIDDAALLQKIRQEEEWIEANLCTKAPQAEGQGASNGVSVEEDFAATRAPPKHPLDVLRIQRFVRTAPAPFEPGGLMTGPPSWYTNPQTEALCRFLSLPNKINARPVTMPFAAPPGGTFPSATAAPLGSGGTFPHPFLVQGQHSFHPPPTAPGHGDVSDNTRKRPWDHDTANPAAQQPQEATVLDPNVLDIAQDDFDGHADQREEVENVVGQPHTLDEPARRWAEGTG